MSPEPIGWKYQSQADKFVTWKPGMDFITTTSTGVDDYIAEQIRKAQDELIMRGSIRFYDEFMANPKAIIKLDNEKETKKMEAKKCDRCGKLYEMGHPCDDISMKVRFKHMFITCKEDMSEQRIIDKQTEKVAIRYDGYGNNDRIDLCEDCCKAFKTWFENADKEKK